ncbi:MAG: TRAP transporter small permease subunit [Pseudomonadota bacterium]
MMQTIRRFYSPFVSVALVANTIGTVVIFILVAIMNVDVIARGIFNAPLRGVFEVVIFSLALIVFLQLPDVVHSNRLTRSDGFLVLMQNRFPAFGSLLGRGIDLIAGIFMACIAYAYWPEFVDSYGSCRFIAGPEFGAPVEGGLLAELKAGWTRCEYYGTPGIFTAPWFPVKFVIAFSVTLCSIIFFFKVFMGNHKPALAEDGEKAT